MGQLHNNMFDWLKRIFQRSLENPAVPASSPMSYEYLGGRRASSGVAVDRVTVLGYPAVWRAVNLISHKIGRLPLIVYKRNKMGGREPDAEHPAYWLLAKCPSSYYTCFTLKSTLQAHALIHGNAYAHIGRNELAEPEEMLILNPEYTFPVREKDGSLLYVTRIRDQNIKMLPENVFHLRGLSHDGIVGYSVLDVLRESFGIGLAAQKYGAVYFRNNGSPGPTIIKLPRALKNEEAVKRFRDQWSYMHEGLDNSHRLCLLEDGAELQPFKIDNETAQFLQTREFEVVQMANLFGVPPHKMGAKIATSYNSLEAEERAFLNDCLDGWLSAWEEEAELKLLTYSQNLRDNRFIEFDRRSLEQADYRTRSETLISEVNNGIRTLDEARQLLNLPDVEGDGDRFRMPTNITFMDLMSDTEDEPATDEPNPQAELPKPPEEDDEPSKPAITEDLEPPPVPQPARALLESVVKRFLKRLYRAATAAAKHHEYANMGWLLPHQKVLAEQIAPIGAREELAACLVAGVRDELQAVTRDQIPAVFERLNPADWTERILNGTQVS